MGRSPCCSKEGLNRGAWTAHEDKILTDYIKAHGEGRWRNLPKRAGLKRCGKSCRLRWLNYLRPDIKRGNISPDEEELIVRLHKLLGNRWSLIAGRLPGRTDNEIKNYWNTNLGKKFQDHQSSTPTHSQLDQDTVKIMKKAETEVFPNKVSQSQPMIIESHVARTKATKRSKVVINSVQPQRVEHFDTSTETGPPMVGDLSLDMPMESNTYNGLSSFANQENNPSDFMMDFNMGEFCLSDLLNSNFSDIRELYYSNDNMLKDWTSSECVQPNVASNLHSFTSFLDSGGDWLGE